MSSWFSSVFVATPDQEAYTGVLYNPGARVNDNWNDEFTHRSKSSSVSSTGPHSITCSSMSSCTNSVGGNGDVTFSTLVNQWPYSLPDCFDDAYSYLTLPITTARSSVDTDSTQSPSAAPKRKRCAEEDTFSASKKLCSNIDDDKQNQPSESSYWCSIA